MRTRGSVRNINFPMLGRVIGILLLIEGCFMLAPLAASYIWGAGRDAGAFLIAIAATLVCGLLMITLIRPSTSDMHRREGYLLTASVWVIFSLFGMLPFLLCSTPLSISEAFFESMSGFTTTGATVLPSVSELSHAILFWRCMMQWIGGMGIILFTLAVLPSLNHSGGMQMFNAEVTGITHDKIRPRISQTAKGLWGIYTLLSILHFFLLWIGPMDSFDALCHTMSSISTGGFSTSDTSIAGWNSPYIMTVLSVFMFLGGVNFVLIYKAVSSRSATVLWKNDVFRTYIYIILFMLVMFDVAILINEGYTDIMGLTLGPLFQIMSTITSTGYTADRFELWGSFVMALTFMLMFFGSCAGSTSGGAKIDRLLYLLKNCRNELQRVLHPNEVLSVRINGKIIPSYLVDKVIAFLCIYVIIIMLGGITLCAMGIPLVDAFFSSFSCLSNTGLGAGVTGYGSSYDVIPVPGMWVLSFLMLVGRLELFTVLILFTSTFWKR